MQFVVGMCWGFLLIVLLVKLCRGDENFLIFIIILFCLDGRSRVDDKYSE